MAESVDALVSNTSGFISMPVRPRLWVLGKLVLIIIKILLIRTYYGIEAVT